MAASTLQIGISLNVNCDIMVSFPKSDHTFHGTLFHQGPAKKARPVKAGSHIPCNFLDFAEPVHKFLLFKKLTMDCNYVNKH